MDIDINSIPISHIKYNDTPVLVSHVPQLHLPDTCPSKYPTHKPSAKCIHFSERWSFNLSSNCRWNITIMHDNNYDV